MDSEVGQCAFHSQQQIDKEQIQTSDTVPGQANYVPHVGAWFVWPAAITGPTFQTMSDAFRPSNRQHSLGQMHLQQPKSDQSTEKKYVISINRINQSNACCHENFDCNDSGHNYSHQETKHATSLGGWAQTDQAAPEQISKTNHVLCVATVSIESSYLSSPQLSNYQ